ncbi:MAG: transglycosylase domain-containing protein [Clostridia bacterium]|nr:transglycosylase domain-containing protein [Clostridia bacterium]
MKKRRKKLRRGVFWRIATFLFLFFTVAVIAGGVWLAASFEQKLPDDFFCLTAKGESPRFFVYHFEDRANRIGEAEELSAGGFAQQERAWVAYPDLPQHLIDAFVSIEDKRFYRHNGVDWYRTLAASSNHLLGGERRFGASTITQQVVKNVTGNNDATVKRKIQEIFYALDLERQLDKTQILEIYLNVIPFSDNCDGIAAAASHYFSKTPQELTVAESATIAAITNSPTYYNPIRNPEHNLQRRNLILSEMYAQGALSESAYQSAIAAPLGLNLDRENGEEGINSWYIDMVIEDVINDLVAQYGMTRGAASNLVYSGGLRIDVAMDEEIQSLVEEYYRTAIRLPTNQNGVRAQSALIVMDAATGDILGVAGAAGEKRGNRVQNFATQTKRPPGSAIKPITVYAPALEAKLIDWASVYDDVPVNFGTGGRLPWPKNATNVYRGLTNIAYAVAHSTNTVPVRILDELGLEHAFRSAKERFHLESLVDADRDVAALALGQLNFGVTLREMTAAYTVFADAGIYHPWRSYYRVLDSDGVVLLACPDRADSVMSTENAAIMTKLLQGVVESGTSSSITLNRMVECAGKTGTTNRDGDRWFVGYTPDMICGVWCGYEFPEPLEGRNLCTETWNRVMKRIVEKKGGREHFDVPSSIVRVSYCKDSGKLLTDACEADPRGSRTEIGWFLADDVPRDFCDCHVLCDYDREHGGVCHGYCPEESCGQVGLIRVNRHFPMQIYVSDAQYVYDGDPVQYSPNENPNQAYYQSAKEGCCGISHAAKQYNRSCTEHLTPPPTKDWEYLFPKLLPTEQE